MKSEMGYLQRRKSNRRIILIFKISIIAFIIVFIGIPLVFKNSVGLQRATLFLNFVKHDSNLDYTKAALKSGLVGVKNFYISYCDHEIKIHTDCQITLGIWHVPPLRKDLFIPTENITKLIRNDHFDDASNDVFIGKVQSSFLPDDGSGLGWSFGQMKPGDTMSDGRPVVLYLHGNTGSRALDYRLDTYRMLRAIGCHVIAMDYRGFGDSSNVELSEDGVVKDAVAVFKWISSIATGPIIIWGHSLGTAIATHLLCLMQGRMIGPSALILESAFTNIYDEIYAHKFSTLFRALPWFDATIPLAVGDSGMKFESDQHVICFHQPILFLHAEDDPVVPFSLGYKLFRTARLGRDPSWGPTEFHRYKGEKQLGHRYISRDEATPEIVRNFITAYAWERY